MTAADLDFVAEKIRYVAERYAQVAVAMRARGIPTLEIGGIDTVLNEIIPNRLGANAGSAERALHLWTGAPQLLSESTDINLAAEAKETFRKANARGKKKRS